MNSLQLLGLKLLAIAALLAGTWWHGHRAGAAGVRAEWLAQQQADTASAEADRETQRLRLAAAAKTYETTRAELQIQAAQARGALRTALAAPACPPGESHALADLPVPAAAVDRLRDAARQSAAAR